MPALVPVAVSSTSPVPLAASETLAALVPATTTSADALLATVIELAASPETIAPPLALCVGAAIVAAEVPCAGGQ